MNHCKFIFWWFLWVMQELCIFVRLNLNFSEVHFVWILLRNMDICTNIRKGIRSCRWDVRDMYCLDYSLDCSYYRCFIFSWLYLAESSDREFVINGWDYRPPVLGEYGWYCILSGVLYYSDDFAYSVIQASGAEMNPLSGHFSCFGWAKYYWPNRDWKDVCFYVDFSVTFWSGIFGTFHHLHIPVHICTNWYMKQCHWKSQGHTRDRMSSSHLRIFLSPPRIWGMFWVRVWVFSDW